MKLAKEFIKFAVKELELKSLPKSIKFVGDEYAAQHLTFGTYQPSTDEVVVVKGTRHPVDVLRTLGHELVHHKQREDKNTAMDGTTGSDAENEANAKAGILMRNFREVYPSIFTEIFNVGPWGFHTNMEDEDVTQPEKVKTILHIAQTGKHGKVDEQYIDGYTAKLLVTVMHKLTTENRKKFVNESIDKMVAVAYKMVTK
jgi:hypothetical protein